MHTHTCTDLFKGHLFEAWQGAGEEAHQEGCGAAHHVQHGGGQHRDEGVLPRERVQQRHHRMGTARQGTEEEKREQTLVNVNGLMLGQGQICS